MIEVQVRPFGAFRDYSASEPITIQLAEGAGLRELRLAFAARLTALRPDLDGPGLVGESAFADDTRLLEETDRFVHPCTVCALPPFCGG
jgi:hypothetical protein